MDKGCSPRKGAPVLLVDQLTGWAMLREGWGVNDIARRMRRLPSEARRIMYGDCVDQQFEA